MDGITQRIRFMNGSNKMEMDWISTDLEGLTDLSELGVGKSCFEGIITFRVDENDGTILVVDGVLVVSLVDNASGQKTDFGSHVDCLIAVGLCCSKMPELKRLVECDYWLTISVGNGCDGPLLGFPGIVGSRSDGDLISCHPVDRVSQFDGGTSSLGGFLHHSPGWLSDGTMHIKGGLSETDAFVTIERKIRIRDSSIHRDGDL